LVAELNSLLFRPESEFGKDGKNKKENEITEVKEKITSVENEIEREKNRQSERGNSEQPD